MFFDREAVTDAVDRASKTVLSKIGAFIRQDAKRSIRPAGKKNISSNPGEPPRSHTGLLKKFIFFGYDTSTRSVVIGPAKLNGVKGKDVPSILEFSGTTTVDDFDEKKRKFTGKKRVHIAARPYMTPAANKNYSKLPAMWANSVTK